MNAPRLARLPDWAGYLVGFAIGYLLFAFGYLWMEGGELWASLTIGVLLHAPVAIVYGSLLVFLHRRWTSLITRSALFVCGIVAGLFPFLGVYPVYVWRLRYAVWVVGIHIAAFAAVIVATFIITRFTKRAHEV